MSTATTPNLSGYVLGFSGAVPERKHWTEPAQDRAILEFVALLSGLVFKYGGRVTHGAHPTFTPVILRQAELHVPGTRSVTICMSDLWARKLAAHERARFERESEFIVVPSVGGDDARDPAVRNPSLTAMRCVLVEKMNVLVAIGGLKHIDTGMNPGVAEEIALARSKRWPCFVIGGFGGEAAHWANEYGVDSLRNGLSPEVNRTLLSSDNVSACVGIIFDHLAQHSATLLPPLQA
jgi:SLOG cluster2